ncbi:MAG: hypothetical protein R2729_17985 [Bryobacteraceae bacterium]
MDRSRPESVPAVVTADDWSQIKAAYQDHRHAVVGAPGSHQARTWSQQWLARFDGRGFSVQPDGADWSWGLELKGFGRVGAVAEQPVRTPARADGRVLIYSRASGLEEWFRNENNGLEHGFTVRARPLGSAALRFELAVRGGLNTRLSEDGQEVVFMDAAGSDAVRYSSLKAWDAAGHALPARMTGSGNAIAIEVDDTGASYPITVDPLAQQGRLIGPSTEAGDQFGDSVAVSGDTVAVGAPLEASNATGINGNQTDNSAVNAGAAYIFVRSGVTWAFQAYIKASNTSALSRFGSSVALSGNTLAVGARTESTTAARSGAVYIFVRSGATWTQQQFLKASNAILDDDFGSSVSLWGDTVAIGAPGEARDTTGINAAGGCTNRCREDAGAVYVFTRSGSVWSQQAYIKTPNAHAGDQFGESVSIFGDTLAAGASRDDGPTFASFDTGAVYVFVRSGAVWTQQQYLRASNPNDVDYFGLSVAVFQDTLVAGAPREDSAATTINGNQSDNTADNAGAAYVFVRSGTSWTQQAYLKASNAQSPDYFGSSVAISGDRILVGAEREQSNATGVNGNQADNSAITRGAAFLFVRLGATWTQEAYLKPSTPATVNGFLFGNAVALVGETPVVGGYNEPAAYVFGPDGSCTYALGSTSASPVASGGPDNFTLSTAAGCPWGAVSNVPWITFSAASGSGNGTIGYIVAANNGAQRVGVITVGGQTFTVTQAAGGGGFNGGPAVPVVGTPSPSFGTGNQQTFTFNFSDADGALDLNVINILINNFIDGRVACYVAYVRPINTLFLVNNAGDAGGPFAGSMLLPGGAGSISNGQCTISAAGSSVVVGGTTLTLTLNISFTAGFGGRKIIYQAARDLDEDNSGWHARGVWTVPFTNTPTAVVSMTPPRVDGNTATLVTTFSDVNGFADLNVMNILINDFIDGRVACYLAYVRSTNTVLLVNDTGDAGGPFAGSFVLGSGSASNSQCTINGVGASVSTSGNTLMLTLPFTFTGTFSGDRVVWAAARDAAANNSDWQAMGTITVP